MGILLLCLLGVTVLCSFIITAYGYSENPDDPNEEPILAYIEDDDVYEKVADAFDEYLDSCEFDEIIDDNDSEE